MYVCTCMCVCMHVCTCIHVYAWVWRSEYNIMSFLRRQQPCYWFLFWFVIAVLGIEPMASYMPAGVLLLSYSPSPHFDFWNGLSLAWRLINRLGWLAHEPQGSTCLCLPSAGVTQYHHLQSCGFVWMWVLRIELKFLCLWCRDVMGRVISAAPKTVAF